MTEKRFNDAKGYIYDKKTCIGIIQDDYTCENVVDLLNSLSDENKQLKQRVKTLKQDNDHKFWKLQFMHQYNETQLFTHELSKAIEQGYEMSDKFKKYLEDLKEFNEKGMGYAKEQEKW